MNPYLEWARAVQGLKVSIEVRWKMPAKGKHSVSPWESKDILCFEVGGVL